MDGVDQTSLLPDGDTYSRRDYVFIYTGPILAATVKGRYKRHLIGDHPGLSGPAFFELYTDPREVSGTLVQMLPALGMVNMMKAGHEFWSEKYPHAPETRDWPLTGIANARPETIAAGKPRVDVSKLPFDPAEAIKKVPGWDGIEIDRGRVRHGKTTRGLAVLILHPSRRATCNSTATTLRHLVSSNSTARVLNSEALAVLNSPIR